MQQVITIQPDGTVSGLQRKKGQGLDLRTLGHADIVRASEIEWNETCQCWHVKVLNEHVVAWMLGCPPGRQGGATLKHSHWQRTVGTAQPDGCHPVPIIPRVSNDCWLGFDDYDDAVQAEVAFLDAMRRRGIF